MQIKKGTRLRTKIESVFHALEDRDYVPEIDKKGKPIDPADLYTFPPQVDFTIDRWELDFTEINNYRLIFILENDEEFYYLVYQAKQREMLVQMILGQFEVVN